MYYLDEVGFSLALPVTYTWSRRGSHNRLRVPTRWGSHGRLNLIGALSWEDQRLHFKLLEGSVSSERVIGFIDRLTRDATCSRVSVVVLDNAGFHKGSKEHPLAPLLYLYYMSISSKILTMAIYDATIVLWLTT